MTGKRKPTAIPSYLKVIDGEAGKHNEVFTIGHSDYLLDAFIGVVLTQPFRTLCDVRRYAGSRRHPHFHRDSLSRVLSTMGIMYSHFPQLGGLREVRPDSPHSAWDTPGLRSYADYMETEEFNRAFESLKKQCRESPTALLCAEANPYRCHRQLISDALLRDGFRVVHILDRNKQKEHTMTHFARIEEGRIIYDGGMLPFDPGPAN